MLPYLLVLAGFILLLPAAICFAFFLAALADFLRAGGSAATTVAWNSCSAADSPGQAVDFAQPRG